MYLIKTLDKFGESGRTLKFLKISKTIFIKETILIPLRFCILEECLIKILIISFFIFNIFKRRFPLTFPKIQYFKNNFKHFEKNSMNY